jgi:hypothetical protein
MPFVAFEHAVQHLAETVGVTPEGTGCLSGIFVAGQHRVDGAQNPLGQQRLALCHRHLAGRRAALQQDLDDFLVFDLQLRHGLGQRGRHLVQREHGLFTGQDGVGVAEQLLPVALNGLHFLVHGGRRRRQAGGRVAFFQIAPALAEIVARIAQQA